MTTQTEAIKSPTEATVTNSQKEKQFNFGQVAPIAGAHFIHDIYTAAIAPLLPVFIEKFSLSLTMAGSFTVFLRLPALLNPFIGYLADRISLRYFVIFAPGVTATLISSLSFASSYWVMVILLLLTGVSVAAFHAPAPAMIGRVSGNQVGLGMSLFMAAGELARTFGPILAVWAVTAWTIDGFYRVVVFGWVATAILFWRLRTVPARTTKSGSLKDLQPVLLKLYLPLGIILLFSDFMLVSLTTYLPTFLNREGASLWLSGAALSLLQFAGVAGALLSGTLSDWMGRKTILFLATISSSLLLLLFLYIDGWVTVPILLLLGFSALSTTPVMLAIIQDQLPEHRAVGNGLFMFLSFAISSVAVLSIGSIGDKMGLRTAYFWGAVLALGAIPAIFFLPTSSRSPRDKLKNLSEEEKEEAND